MYAPWRPRTPREDPLLKLWYAGWGVDWLYDRLFVMPFQFLVHRTTSDVIDAIYTGIAALTDSGSRLLRVTQNGRVRWYATGIAAGFIVLFAIALFVSVVARG
jgi:NADH-quinone oxidoreductase subunit L